MAAVLRAAPLTPGVAVASGRTRGANRVGVPGSGASAVPPAGAAVGGSLGKVAVAEMVSVGVSVGVG